MLLQEENYSIFEAAKADDVCFELVLAAFYL